AKYELDHERSGEVVLVSSANSWQAYYWWLDAARAPAFARTVDIHRKPGYDPVELFFDPATRSIPLNATLVKGSHGSPATGENQRGVIFSSERGVLTGSTLADTDVYEIVLRQFGI
ncbi:MAG TPA: alkaline phosphatase family protein, partial [Pirellulales bacterium]